MDNSKRRMRLRRIAPAAPLAVAAIATLVPAHPLIAEEQPAAKGAIEEIIVTAQKRETSLQDTPISMTALGADDLAFRGVTNLADLQRQVPNLNYGEREGGATVTIRGVGLNVEFGAVESGVASHIDGHYQPKVTSGILGLNDVERVEVLRGPQGTLYGRNATGGAINFILKKPTDEFEATARLAYGSFDTKHAFGVVSGPVIRGLLNARVYGEYDETDGFIKNLTLNRTVGDRDGYGARFALAFFPLQHLTVDLSAITRSDHLSPVEVMVEPPKPDLEARLTIIPPSTPADYVLGDLYAVKEQRRGRGHKETHDLTTTVTWDTAYATVKSITGAQYHYLNFGYENDVEDRSTFFLNTRRDRSISLTQEVNLSHTFDLPLEMRFDWLVGAFYFKENYDVFIPVDINTGAAGLGLFVFASGVEDVHAYAGFGDATLWLTKWLRLFGGLRQSFEDKSLLQSVRAFAGPTRIPVPPLPSAVESIAQVSLCTGLDLSTRFNNLSPRFGAQVDVTDSFMAYAQRQLGFKAGGANPFACNNIYKPEDVDSYEVGFKSTWLDRRVTANFSLFTNQYTNFQVLKTQGLEGPVVNADSASIKGAELEIRARPFAGYWKRLEPFELDVIGAWLHARYDVFTDTDPANPGPPGFPLVQDLAGHHLNRAPDYTLNVGGEYEWPIPIQHFGALRVRGEWFHTADIWYRPYGTPGDIQSGYSLWNAFASVSDSSGKFELGFFGKNLGNTEYLTMVAGLQIGSLYGEPGEPRTFGTELTMRF